MTKKPNKETQEAMKEADMKLSQELERCLKHSGYDYAEVYHAQLVERARALEAERDELKARLAKVASRAKAAPRNYEAHEYEAVFADILRIATGKEEEGK